MTIYIFFWDVCTNFNVQLSANFNVQLSENLCVNTIVTILHIKIIHIFINPEEFCSTPSSEVPPIRGKDYSASYFYTQFCLFLNFT